MSSLTFQPVRDAELCWVDARLKKKKLRSTIEFPEFDNDEQMVDEIQEISSNDKSNENKQPNLDETAMEVENEGEFSAPKPVRMNAKTESDQFCLDVLASNQIPPHEAVFVNDPKLSDIRVYLNKNGFSAEFSAGVLYVNDVVRISRNEAGRFEIESNASTEAYTVQVS